MSTQVLPIQTPTSVGAVTVYTTAQLQNTFTNTGRQVLLVKNGSGSSINVTIKGQLQVDGTTVADKVVAIGAGAEKLIGPISPQVYNDSTGSCEVDISVITTVTIALIQIP